MAAKGYNEGKLDLSRSTKEDEKQKKKQEKKDKKNKRKNKAKSKAQKWLLHCQNLNVIHLMFIFDVFICINSNANVAIRLNA